MLVLEIVLVQLLLACALALMCTSAHATNSWTRTVSNTNMYIGHYRGLDYFVIECIVQGFISSNCVNIYN